MYRGTYNNRVSFQGTFVAGDNPHMIPHDPPCSRSAFIDCQIKQKLQQQKIIIPYTIVFRLQCKQSKGPFLIILITIEQNNYYRCGITLWTLCRQLFPPISLTLGRRGALQKSPKILKYNTRPRYSLFTLLPSGRRYRRIRCLTTRVQENVFIQVKTPKLILYAITQHLYFPCFAFFY